MVCESKRESIELVIIKGEKMTVQQAIITLIAAIISGILATIITISINAYLADIKRKQDLVDDIFGFKYQLTDDKVTNHDIYAKGFSRAMNRVPIVFCKDRNVLDKYDIFFNTLLISDENERRIKSDEALINFLKELCKAAHIKSDNWNDSVFKRTFNIDN